MDNLDFFRDLNDFTSNWANNPGPEERRIMRELDNSDESAWDAQFVQKVRKGTARVNVDF